MKENENSQILDPAKERVQKELEELKEKIVKLSAFLFSEKIICSELSQRMKDALSDQLRTMQEYARILQFRLSIWGKNDEELRSDDPLTSPLSF